MSASVAVPFLDLQSINARFEPAFHAALRDGMARGQWVLGSEVAAFEREFAQYCGCAHAVAVANGMDALELVLRAWGVGPGDEVVVPGMTFVATWLAVEMVGATIVPVDPNPTTFTVDSAAVRHVLGPHTKAVIPVHLYGRVAPMKALCALARRQGIRVLEDAAQAHGAELAGRRAGSFGDAAAFSFYPAKNLGALGDGGAITTDDAALAAALRELRNYGSSQRYVHRRIGRNSRLDELQAAFLRLKLRSLDADNARRRAIAGRYLDAFSDLELELPPHDEDSDASAWHLFVVRHSRRDALRQALAERGVETHVHYPAIPSAQQAFAHRCALSASLPVSAAMAAQVLSLPIGPTMREADVSRVIDAVRAAAQEVA